MFAIFRGASTPMRMCRPAGGGPLCAAWSRIRWKNALAKSRRLRSFEISKPAAASSAAVVGGGRDKAGFGARRPRHGIGQRTVALAHHIVDTEHAPRDQDSADLGEQPGFVLDVHADMNHVRAVERSGREGERKCAAVFVRDRRAKTDSPRQRLGDRDIFFRQVDARDPTSVVLREIARRAAKTGTDVE